jgi:hypothetical protein
VRLWEWVRGAWVDVGDGVETHTLRALAVAEPVEGLKAVLWPNVRRLIAERAGEERGWGCPREGSLRVKGGRLRLKLKLRLKLLNQLCRDKRLHGFKGMIRGLIRDLSR